MKNYLNIILAILFSTTILFSCKKDGTPSAKDYAASIKDKTWWGELTYTGKATEYCGIYFNADNTLLWSQFSGDYTGHWTLNGKELTITFDVSSSEIKANISDDNELENITDNSSGFEISSGQLIANPNIPLDNTLWKGIVEAATNYASEMNFLTTSLMDLKINNTPYGLITYTRSKSGGVVRAAITGGGAFFGIITSGSEMKGSLGNVILIYPWQAVKQ